MPVLKTLIGVGALGLMLGATSPQHSEEPAPAVVRYLETDGLCPASLSSEPDIDITYIERTPRYHSYANQVTYFHNQAACPYPYDVDRGAQLCPGAEDDQRWPEEGEVVTFSAHIQNKGGSDTGPFRYEWALNGARVAGGTIENIPPCGEAVVSQPWQWAADHADHSDQTVAFAADPDDTIDEVSEENNLLEDFIEAMTFHIQIDEAAYERFSRVQNGVGSYSFEDWIQWQIGTMNEYFAKAVYPTSPEGILERVRIDRISVVPTGGLPCGGTHASNNGEYDGVWGFDSRLECGGMSEEGLERYAVEIEHALRHELTHQLGIIDLYAMNLHTGANHVHAQEGTELGESGMGFVFLTGGIMGGGDTSPYYDGAYYSSHTAAALNLNLGYRRGWYGEYLYDVPDSNTILVRDAEGNPLSGARVRIYQMENRELSDSSLIQAGYTDAQGRFALADRSVNGGTTTSTGHTLQDNPFGLIDVVGTNGVLLVRVEAYGQEDFQWLELPVLNFAYWAGHTEEATYEIATNLIDRDISDVNLALGKEASASTSNWDRPAEYAIDGIVDSAWLPEGGGIPGDWWQVDLGRAYPVSQIRLHAGGGGHELWFNRFRIEASLTGEFEGEQTVLVDEDAWYRKIMDHVRPAIYVFSPTEARYVRVVGEMRLAGWVELQEFEVMAEKKSASERDLSHRR